MKDRMETNEKYHIEKKCPACGKLSPGKYCMHCGELLEHDRITLRHFLKSVPEIVFHVGFNIFGTIYELIRRPGKMVKAYFAGNRLRHYKPINFFLFIGGLVAVLFIGYHISGPDSKMYEDWIDDKELGQQLDKFNNAYLTAILLVQFPIAAFFTWLFFRKREHYFGEHLVANAFFIGEVSLYKIVLFPIYLIFNKTSTVDILDDVYALFVVGYYVYAFYDWLYDRKTWKGFFITLIFVVLLYAFIMTVTLFLVPGLYFIKTGLSGLF
jgi:hypothetical protein